MIETHEDINIDDFIIELRLKGVCYDPDTNSHWRGSKPFKGEKEGKDLISGNDMRTMCEHHFGDDYTKHLSEPEQRKLRVKIFGQLRGNKENG